MKKMISFICVLALAFSLTGCQTKTGKKTSTVDLDGAAITTTADNSGGIQTTGGATTNASNLQITTSGNSSAAIRSDRGGGTVKVDGGSYISNGYNSPAVYSTPDMPIV